MFNESRKVYLLKPLEERKNTEATDKLKKYKNNFPMKYFDKIMINKLHNIEGCTIEEINFIEESINKKIPGSLREYLLYFGHKQNIFLEWDLHGCNDMIEIYNNFNYWVNIYESKNIDMSNQKNIIPFYNCLDTTFYLNLNGSDDPEVLAIDIGDEPTIRKLGDNFSGFIKYVIEKRLKGENW